MLYVYVVLPFKRKVDLHKYFSCLSSRTILEQQCVSPSLSSWLRRAYKSYAGHIIPGPVKVVYTKVLSLLHVKRVKLLERDKNVHDKTRVINL